MRLRLEIPADQSTGTNLLSTQKKYTQQEEEENKLATVYNVRERERDNILVDNSNFFPFLRLVR